MYVVVKYDSDINEFPKPSLRSVIYKAHLKYVLLKDKWFTVILINIVDAKSIKAVSKLNTTALSTVT